MGSGSLKFWMLGVERWEGDTYQDWGEGKGKENLIDVAQRSGQRSRCGVRLPKFMPLRLHLLAVHLFSLNSLCSTTLNFHICKMGIIRVPTIRFLSGAREIM